MLCASGKQRAVCCLQCSKYVKTSRPVTRRHIEQRGGKWQTFSIAVKPRSVSKCRPAATARIVATSEFWWEEEPEYDAVKDILSPKDVVIIAAINDTGRQDVEYFREALGPYIFQSCFTSEQTKSVAEAVWEGRSKPPYFYKLRTQASLDELANTSSTEAAEEFWQQLCTQNWRVELDYGLNKGTDSQAPEAVLVVTTAEASSTLIATLPDSDTILQSRSPSRFTAISFGGWNKEEALHSWKQLEVTKAQPL